MKKLVLMLALVAMSVPAFANTNESAQDMYAPLEEGFVPADQIDFSAASDESSTAVESDAALYQHRPGPPRGPGHGPGRPGPGRPGPGRPGPGRPYPPQRPPQRAFICDAGDRMGYVWRSQDWDLNRARNEALRACQYGSRLPRSCRLIGCGSR